MSEIPSRHAFDRFLPPRSQTECFSELTGGNHFPICLDKNMIFVSLINKLYGGRSEFIKYLFSDDLSGLKLSPIIACGGTRLLEKGKNKLNYWVSYVIDNTIIVTFCISRSDLLLRIQNAVSFYRGGSGSRFAVLHPVAVRAAPQMGDGTDGVEGERESLWGLETRDCGLGARASSFLPSPAPLILSPFFRLASSFFLPHRLVGSSPW